jgi:phosphoribosylaminoimidazole-succinocarboxamide synthase
MKVLLETRLALPLAHRGKVRDTYTLDDKLLLIATDRISAFDVVLPCGIPHKGLVLNQISTFWFGKTKHILDNHLIHTLMSQKDLKSIGLETALPDYVLGRSMIVQKAKRVPIEAVVRGYISGSAWEEYKSRGSISGIEQPVGLLESQKLPEPIFTPTTKADSGHDLPMNIAEIENLLGKEIASMIKEKSISIYNFAQEYALHHGIIIADTKFEFGFVNNQLILIDELITPDSSRFWDLRKYASGKSQPSFDKQPVRDWLKKSGWNQKDAPPMLPEEVIVQTTERYKTAYKMLTGKDIVK